jgi:hypothetical protein
VSVSLWTLTTAISNLRLRNLAIDSLYGTGVEGGVVPLALNRT